MGTVQVMSDGTPYTPRNAKQEKKLSEAARTRQPITLNGKRVRVLAVLESRPVKYLIGPAGDAA